LLNLKLGRLNVEMGLSNCASTCYITIVRFRCSLSDSLEGLRVGSQLNVDSLNYTINCIITANFQHQQIGLFLQTGQYDDLIRASIVPLRIVVVVNQQ